MRHLKDLHFLILGLGLGASGLAMARWFAHHGAKLTVADTRETPLQLTALRQKPPDTQFVDWPFYAAPVEGKTVRALNCSPGLSPLAAATLVAAAGLVRALAAGRP